MKINAIVNLLKNTKTKNKVLTMVYKNSYQAH